MKYIIQNSRTKYLEKKNYCQQQNIIIKLRKKNYLL